MFITKKVTDFIGVVRTGIGIFKIRVMTFIRLGNILRNGRLAAKYTALGSVSRQEWVS